MCSKLLILQNLFCTNCFIPRFDLGLVVQNHVQQGIMDFQFSVVFDKTQFAEFCKQKEKSGEALFARIEQLVDQVLFNSTVPSQQIRHEQFRKLWLIVNGGDHGRLL